MARSIFAGTVGGRGNGSPLPWLRRQIKLASSGDQLHVFTFAGASIGWALLRQYLWNTKSSFKNPRTSHASLSGVYESALKPGSCRG